MNTERKPHGQPPQVAIASPAPLIRGAPVVLYDGLCGLCDRYVQFVLRRDHRGAFRFAPLQGAFATQALTRHGLAPAENPRSLALVESPGSPGERLRLRSDAVLAVLTGLGGAWRLLSLLRVIPRPLRDLVYAVVAGLRYRVFGRLVSCSVPPPSAGSDRFLA